MKKYLLPQSGNFYKANLHSHSTVSDGSLTPEEMKALYKSAGYSVLAYTDHNLLISQNHLTDSDFLALNGLEIDVASDAQFKTPHERRVCHICFIALEPDNFVNPLWHRTEYKYPGGVAASSANAVFDESKPDYVRRYGSEGVSEMMRIARDEGFFVTYNHPTWSLEGYPEYIGYEGMHAFEMFNGGCLVGGYDDYNPRVYDDILRSGKRIYAIGSDDNHNRHPQSSRHGDSCIAFTMIKAESLDYRAVTSALVNGSFYSSEAPEIYELYYEDGVVHIKTSPADRIQCILSERGTMCAFSEEPCGTVTEAEFRIPEYSTYFRITVVDKSGKHACTNAYFTDELKI